MSDPVVPGAPSHPRRAPDFLAVPAAVMAAVVAVAVVAVVAVMVVAPAGPALAAAGPAVGGSPGTGRATTDASPVDLGTHVDLADGMAHPSAVVRSGDARIEVLSPTLLRLEYSPTATFENSPTVNAVDRRMTVPPYRTEVSDGWLTVRTSRALLRYKVGSGPFTAENTSLQFTDAGRSTTVHPAWEWVCTFGQTCQAGAASLAGGASLGQGSSGYVSTAGYIGNFLAPGARATWQVLGAPAGTADVTLRYSTFPVAFHPPPSRTFDLLVDGRRVDTLTAPLTASANQWSDLSTTVTLRPGTNSVEIRCGPGEGCDTDVDTLSVTAVGSPPVDFAPTDPLGGWIRGFDTATYNVSPSCVDGEVGDTCQAGLQPLVTDGLLDGAGWRLLDDTHSAVWTDDGWVRPRPADGDTEDGYLFAYGHDYAGALETLARLTGPAPLPPKDVFGVWYSDYTPYSSADVEDQLYPAFRSNDVPLDTLSLDTDWKSPNDWNGWEWNTSLFPDAGAFLAWARAHDIDVTLNIHSSIDDNDPELPATERVAGHDLAASSCSAGPCKVWDWSSVAQAESNFALQQSFERQGVAFWWLDWCCDASVVSMPGVTPDSWIDHLYAQEMTDRGRRGFVLARIGGSNADPEEVYPAGPWSAHTSAIAFTGDAWGTWNTLAREAELTQDEATIGEPYVSDDIGSFLGPPPTQSGADPPDLYDRWVQFGTFQPILRLHSDDEDRLPWEYPQPVAGITEAFLRLRAALVPYTYTLAAEASGTGLPMARPLYLDYPAQPAAYAHPTEYLYGPDVLVAPVTAPGSVVDTTVWIPPGRWVDYFTGATLTGPLTTTVAEPLDRMPVFVRSGGIIPEQAGPARDRPRSPAHLTVRVYPGATGSFRLYGDAGTDAGAGAGNAAGTDPGRHTETLITTHSTTADPGRALPAGTVPTTTVRIGPTTGHYPGEATTVAYRVELVGLRRPTGVTVDGRALAVGATASVHPGWSYQPSTDTVEVVLGADAVTGGVTVTERGGGLAERSEPTPAPGP